jgi:hypothetical protein
MLQFVAMVTLEFRGSSLTTGWMRQPWASLSVAKKSIVVGLKLGLWNEKQNRLV